MGGGIPLLIRQLAATFGRLDKQTLTLREGLNIIEAPNEAGKSTWCAFLTAMLYGIDSRQRDKAGFIAEKNRYAPWNGAAMQGRLDCRVGGKELTLLRETRRPTAPLGTFRAVYSGTGDEVPGLTGDNCGETLLGVSREVFERSAFIRQAGLPITQDAGLEKRIAALITTGEEDTSYSETAELLKKQLNRRRHNKTGQLPALEGELAEVGQRLAELARLEGELVSTRAEAERLAAREAAARKQLAQCGRYEAAQKRQALAEAGETAQAAQRLAEELQERIDRDRIPENDAIGRLRAAIVNLETVRKSVDKARAERDEALKTQLRAEAAVGGSPFAGETAEQTRRDAAAPPKVCVRVAPSLAVFFAGLLVAAGAAAFTLSRYGLWLNGWMRAIPWGLFAVILCAAWALSHQIRRRAIAQACSAALEKRFGTARQADLDALADTYIKLLDAQAAAQANTTGKSAAAEALYASLSSNEQGILLEVRRFAPSAFDIPAADEVLRESARRRRELTDAQVAAREAQLRREILAQQLPPEDPDSSPVLPPPASRETLEAEAEESRNALAASRSAVDQLTGQIGAVGDPIVLRARAEQLREKIDALEAEYAAIVLALEALDAANTTLQNRFSPELGRRAAEIFAQLTDGRYSGVVLDRGFHLQAEAAGDPVYRDVQLLSAGAADQLYLATRLAICELVLPEDRQVPIVLDDALANFDNGRARAALSWLRREAAGRQVLLFTCHSRERDWLEGDPSVFIQRLTEPGVGV